MKKIFMVLAIVFSCLLMPTLVEAKSKVTIYVFRGYDCPHCEEALEYINEHKDQLNSEIEVKTFEVWKNTNNAKLMDKVADKLGVVKDKNFGVPFFVVGEEYSNGYGSSTFGKLKSMAEEYLEKEYKDVVKEVIKEENLNVEELALNEIFSEPNKVVTIVVYVVFGVIVLGLIAMIVFARR